MTDRCDVVVVGGGLAGLVATATAAREGAQVTLLESRRLGGRGRTSEYQGFHLNQGPHAVYRRGALAAAAKRLGIEPAGGLPPLDGAHVWRDGARHPMPGRSADMARSKLLRFRSKLVARKVIGVVEKGPAEQYANVSLSQFLADAGSPDDLTAFVEMIARLSTYANCPDLLSAEAFIKQYRLGGGGVLYLDGGWQQLVDGFAGVAREHGAKILDHRVMLGLERVGSEWVARTDEGDVAASAVVLAAGLPAEAARLAGDDLGWTTNAGPAVRAACLDLGVSAPAEVPFMLGMDEPYYLSTHAPPAKLAPEGQRVISLARYLRPDDVIDRSTSEAGLWQHAERAGVDRTTVVADRYLHDMVVAGGVPLATQGGFAGRPSVVVAERPGLFLAGDWVGETGLIGDAAAASGTTAGLAACARVGELAA